ncbi:MAG: sugar ABC transporter ATP-binding protein [Candidatus Anaerobiospirillum pullicola]|uniref:Sugar ABC transporter ATP-binding protein n=1 Tax=Candidatus Anaerobiospirillum pullicola TaxID=2838451 RepID=A0A948TI19_9GAMM|nr:sugar ABC transporter ATP-binding protein [Candidatus Anaerobiospirillum pullicola]
MGDNGDFILQMKDIDMFFPGVKALKHAKLNIKRGEIHSLMGENGAGKSTLVKVLTGVYHKTAGTVIFDGHEIEPESPLKSQQIGISTVYQEVNLCANLTVAENIYIGREPRGKFGQIDWATMNANAKKLLQEELGLDLDVGRVLDFYPVAVQQMIAIARAIDTKCKILILDEPTSSLSDRETERLFTIMRKLKSQGIAIIFISHFLEQIYTICDRITILRDGEYVGEYEVKTLERIDLISKMMGKKVDENQIESNVDKSVPLEENEIETNHMVVEGKVKDLNMYIKKGEVVGFAGLLGSGRTEIADALFGITPISSGEIKVEGVTVKVKSPMDQMKNRIAFCPEDRKVAGIIGDLSVRENIILAMQAKDGMFKHMPMSKQKELADKYIDLLRIKVSDREQLIKNLSGGNQQKVIIARWLATKPNLLILDEPTRGIDVGTKSEIEALSVRLAKEEGMAVVFISGEMGEMVRTCSRILVIRDHEKITELNGDEISTAHIMQAIAGDYHGSN